MPIPRHSRHLFSVSTSSAFAAPVARQQPAARGANITSWRLCMLMRLNGAASSWLEAAAVLGSEGPAGVADVRVNSQGSACPPCYPDLACVLVRSQWRGWLTHLV